MAASMTVISSMATKAIVAALASAYTHDTGTPVSLVSIGGVDAVKRIRAGAAFDIALLAKDAVAALASDGFIAQETVRAFATSRTAVAVRPGMAHPAGCDEAAIKSLIAAARGIGLSTGPSGVSMLALFQRWGIYEAMKGRIVQAPAGVPVAELLGRGDVDVGFQQVSELLGHSGIEIAGTLPDRLLPPTVFAAGMRSGAQNLPGARALMQFLRSDAAIATKQRNGMEPA